MSQAADALVPYRLGRAREALDAARLLLEKDHLHACINRLYYACFYAASALLLTKGLTATKHAGVIALFNKHWVKEGLLPKQLGTTLSALFAARQEADYADLAEFDPAEAWQWLKASGNFVSTIAAHIREVQKE